MQIESSNIIRDAGLKFTPQRSIVYQAMRKLEHSSVEGVINDVHDRYPEISVATIYRILDTFAAAGLLLKFAGPQGRIYFDITPEEHLHFFTSDDRILDIADQDLATMIRQRLTSQLPAGQSIDEISICITTKNNHN